MVMMMSRKMCNQKKIKIVFMGTPEFAVPSLQKLREEGYKLCGVFTRPDKPKGRGMKLQQSPVKEYALRNNLPVFQPPGFKNGQALDILKMLNPDMIVVVAYGRILPKEVLDLPRLECVNVHASLLPKYRGAAPIQWAVARGETETGITTMIMSEGLDEGDILLQKAIPILSGDTGGSVHDRLMELGAQLLSETVKQIIGATVRPVPQDNDLATFAPIITKGDALIDWNKDAQDIINLIRGMNPWPVAHTKYNDAVLRIFAASQSKKNLEEYSAGSVIIADPEHGIEVCCGGQTALVIERLQIQGKKQMSAADYLRGHPIKTGTRFESDD